MTNYIEIKVPQENVADSTMLVTKLCLRNGDKVNRGSIIAEVETSKAVFELPSTGEGYIHYKCYKGDQLEVNSVIAVLYEVQEDAILAEKEIVGVKSLPSEKSFSRKALFLIGKHGLDKNVFSANVIREKDVVEYIQKIEGFHISRQVNSVAQKVLIWGGGGHAKMCIDILRQSNSFSIAGIIDSMKHGVAESILGVPVIGKDENDFARLYKQGYRLAILGIGLVEKHRTREKLYFTLREMGFDLPNIIHPKACVEPSVRIDGDGNQIMANAVIGSDVRIGSNCVINCGSIISHDSIIDSSVHVAPGAILAGSVKVGRNTLIGMGCTVFLRVEIGADVVVHNGVNVFRNIADNEVVSKDK